MDAPTEPAPDPQQDPIDLLRRLVDAVIPPEAPEEVATTGADPAEA